MIIYLVANEGPKGGGGFNWYPGDDGAAKSAAEADFRETMAKAPLCTEVFLMRVELVGTAVPEDRDKLTEFLGDHLPIYEAFAYVRGVAGQEQVLHCVAKPLAEAFP